MWMSQPIPPHQLWRIFVFQTKRLCSVLLSLFFCLKKRKEKKRKLHSRSQADYFVYNLMKCLKTMKYSLIETFSVFNPKISYEMFGNNNLLRVCSFPPVHLHLQSAPWPSWRWVGLSWDGNRMNGMNEVFQWPQKQTQWIVETSPLDYWMYIRTFWTTMSKVNFGEKKGWKMSRQEHLSSCDAWRWTNHALGFCCSQYHRVKLCWKLKNGFN